MSSCEEQKRIIEPFVPSGNKVVLLEEFTGKGCTNCPKGSREIENLLSLFPDNLVAVSIHAGNFADPAIFTLGQYDLRAPQSNELLDLLSPINFYPTGTVDRTKVGNGLQLGLNQWASAISKQIEIDPIADLSVVREYDPATRTLEVTVNGIAKQNVTGDIRLSIMLLESGIVDAQDDNENGGIVEDYVHNHVLRDMLTPAAGASVATSLSAGETFTFTGSTTLNGAWVAENMEIVAFVSNVQGGVFPVVQATSIHVTE
jgi:hypothetical protein